LRFIQRIISESHHFPSSGMLTKVNILASYCAPLKLRSWGFLHGMGFPFLVWKKWELKTAEQQIQPLPAHRRVAYWLINSRIAPFSGDKTRQPAHKFS
jgi:hypothetical protein